MYRVPDGARRKDIGMQTQASRRPLQGAGSLFDFAPLFSRAFAIAILLAWAQASIGSVNVKTASVSESPVPAHATEWASINPAARPTCAGSSGAAPMPQSMDEVPDGSIGCGVGDNFARGTRPVHQAWVHCEREMDPSPSRGGRNCSGVHHPAELRAVAFAVAPVSGEGCLAASTSIASVKN